MVHEDVGYGMDVTLLHHDVGLVRTRHDMHLEHSPSTLNALTLYYTMDMRNQEVEVSTCRINIASRRSLRSDLLRACRSSGSGARSDLRWARSCSRHGCGRWRATVAPGSTARAASQAARTRPASAWATPAGPCSTAVLK